MNNGIRPRRGLYERWRTFLKGALIAFGVVVLTGGAALAFDRYSGPEELRRLQQTVEEGDFSDYDLEDFQRLNELRGALAGLGANDLEVMGTLLLDVGFRLFLACALLIAAQDLVRWLWFGSEAGRAGFD